jgi:serine/threonine-protein kinase
VVGEQQSAALAALSNFNPQTKTDPTSNAPAGQVVRQVPAAGTLLAPGSNVTIYVSGGGAQVSNVIGDPQATATQILQGEGFKVDARVVAGPANSTPGDVFNQNPTSGNLPAGSTVTIYVAATPAPTPTATTPSATPTATASATPTASATTSPTSGGGGTGH